MQAVSTPFKNAVVSGDVTPVRQTLLTLVDNVEVAASISTAVTGTADALTPASKAVNGISVPERQWAWVDPYEALNQGAVSTPHLAYRRLVRRDGAARYYRLGERSGTQVWDSGGNAQHGTYQNGPTLQATGLLSGDPDCAVGLNGTNQYITIPSLGIAGSSWSVECWLKCSVVPGTLYVVWQAFTSAANNQEVRLILQPNGQLLLNFFGNAMGSLGGTWAFDSNPHHIICAYTFGANTASIFMDGALVGGPTSCGPMAGAAPSWTIGAGDSPLNYYVNGTIDEFAIYPLALSSSQAAAHYAARSVIAVQRCLPNSTFYALGAGYEGGWWGGTLADADGNISPAETFTLSYSPAVKIRTISWVADLNLGAPVDFIISYDPNGNGIFTTAVSVSDYAGTSYSVDLGALTTVAAIRISITRVMYPYRYAKLYEFGGTWQVDISDDIVSQNVLIERQNDAATIETGNSTANELSAEFRNDSLNYNPNNAAGTYYGYLKKNRKVDVYVGVRYADTSTELIRLGRYYSYIWSAANGGLPATLKAQDGMKLLRDKKYATAPLLINNTVDQIIRQTLIDAGLGYGNYTLATSSVVIPYAWCAPTSTFFDYLVKLAEAAAGAIWFDETGAFHFEDGATLLNKTGSVFTFTDSNAIIATQDEYDDGLIRNRVTIPANALQVQALAQIWALQEILSLLPGEVRTVNVQFNSPATNVQTPVLTSGADIVIQSWTAYGAGGALVLKNNGAAIEQVTAATIQGQALQTQGATIMVAENQIAVSAEGVSELTISNNYLQNQAMAQAIANTLLNIYQSPPPKVSVQSVGLPHLQVGDVVTVNSASAGINGDFYIQRHEFADDGGWVSNFTLLGLIYATDYPTRATLWHQDALVTVGNAITSTMQSLQGYGFWSGIRPAANGDTFTQSVFLRAGLYTFSVLGIADTDKGLHDWYLDNVLFVLGQDWYAAATTRNVIKTVTVTVPNDGYHVLKCVVNGKNAGSTGYTNSLTKYWFKKASDG